MIVAVVVAGPLVPVVEGGPVVGVLLVAVVPVVDGPVPVTVGVPVAAGLVGA